MDTVRNLLAMLEDKLLTVAVTAARPDDPADGVSILPWRINNKFSSPRAALFLDGSATATLESPTGGSLGVELWGFVLSKWWLIGYLNRGEDIPITDGDRGFAQQFDVGGVFERLAIAGTPSAGAVTAFLCPIESWS